MNNEETTTTKHLEFTEKEDALKFLSRCEEKGYKGTIHRIMKGVSCRKNDEPPVYLVEQKVKESDGTVTVTPYYFHREFSGKYFVSLWRTAYAS